MSLVPLSVPNLKVDVNLSQVRLLLEDEGVASTIQLLKRKDHFIFTIESTGILPPEELLTQAIDILHEKAHRLSEKL